MGALRLKPAKLQTGELVISPADVPSASTEFSPTCRRPISLHRIPSHLQTSHQPPQNSLPPADVPSASTEFPPTCRPPSNRHRIPSHLQTSLQPPQNSIPTCRHPLSIHRIPFPPADVSSASTEFLPTPSPLLPLYNPLPRETSLQPLQNSLPRETSLQPLQNSLPSAQVNSASTEFLPTPSSRIRSPSNLLRILSHL